SSREVPGPGTSRHTDDGYLVIASEVRVGRSQAIRSREAASSSTSTSSPSLGRSSAGERPDVSTAENGPEPYFAMYRAGSASSPWSSLFDGSAVATTIQCPGSVPTLV